MKGALAVLSSYIGVGSLRILVPVLLGLAAAVAFLFVTSPAAAGPPIDDLNLPIELEESRDAPKHVQRDVQGRGVTRAVIPNSSTLIKNTAQTGPFTNDFANDYAQAFTTGNHSDGYKLTSVEMFMSLGTGTDQPDYTLAIHGGTTTAPNATSIGTLSGGTSLSSTLTLQTFTAPGTGINLDASTTYWVVMNVTGSSNNTATVGVVGTDNEDTGGAAGWSIADDRRWRSWQATAWDGANRPAEFRLAVKGYLKVKADLESAEIIGTKLVLTFDQNLNTASGTAAGAFTVNIGGTSHTPSAISISGREVTLTVPEATSDQTVTVSYTKGGNPLKSSDGPEVDSFTNQAVSHGRIDPLSQPPRAPITVTYTNAAGQEETVENRAASAERDTLYAYFEDSCQSQKDLSARDLAHDYTQETEIVLPNGKKRTVTTQAANGWKWVWVQDANGNVTGTRAQTVAECASHGMYLRQQTCANRDWRDRNPHILESYCPTYRTW